MGDRTFTAEDDSANVGPVAPAAWDTAPRPVIDDADAYAGVTRRLQSRLDRQLWLLERLGSRSVQAELPQLPELLDLARRMRRDSESLLLLAGHDPAVAADPPSRLGELLAVAVAAAEHPGRITVVPAAQARVLPGAAIELLHVMTELLDHAAAVYPEARIEVASRIEGSGVTLEVQALESIRRTLDAPDAQRSLDAAERLARRSRHGIGVHRELGDGGVASVTAPPAAVLVDPMPRPTPVTIAKPVYADLVIANPGVDDIPVDPVFADEPVSPLAPVASERFAGDPLPLVAPADRYADEPVSPLAPAVSERNIVVTPPSGIPVDAPYTPRPGKIDELFGPLSDIVVDPSDEPVHTPIFEAIASAWFSHEDRSDLDGTPGPSSPLDWDTPNDRAWREAAERVSRVESASLTATGLPRRRPGTQLVPPPRTRGAAEPPVERVPDRIRERLSGYQRGLEQGRHHSEAAAQAEQGDSELW